MGAAALGAGLRAAALAARLLAAWPLVAGGCATWRGPFEPGLDAPAPAGVSLVLLGEAGLVGRSGEPTADAVRQVLGRADATVILLGDHVPHVLDGMGRPKAKPGATPVAAALPRDPDRRIAVGGASEPKPSGSSVVRIGKDGRANVVSRCEARSCELVAGDDGERALLELVVLDLETWRRAPVGNDDALSEIEALLELLARTTTEVPRVLVTYMPVEGGFEHGLGALTERSASFHDLPQRVQQAIQQGMFVGVIAGAEHAVHATTDVGRTIMRTDKVWPVAPVWQVVSGHAAGPRAGHGVGWRRTKLAQGTAFRPELATDHHGFAVLEVGESDRATLDVYARKHRRWWRARKQLTLAPQRFHGPRDAPSMVPCMRCDEVPATDRR